jgi:hypothetical protein
MAWGRQKKKMDRNTATAEMVLFLVFMFILILLFVDGWRLGKRGETAPKTPGPEAARRRIPWVLFTSFPE